jgi:hypothetical protein
MNRDVCVYSRLVSGLQIYDLIPFLASQVHQDAVEYMMMMKIGVECIDIIKNNRLVRGLQILDLIPFLTSQAHQDAVEYMMMTMSI